MGMTVRRWGTAVWSAAVAVPLPIGQVVGNAYSAIRSSVLDQVLFPRSPFHTMLRFASTAAPVAAVGVDWCAHAVAAGATHGVYSMAVGPWLTEAQRNLDEGRDGVAERLARRAIDREPHNVEAHHILGQVLRNQERLAEAVDVYRVLVELEPSNNVFKLELAETLWDHNEAEEAVFVLESAVADNPYVTTSEHDARMGHEYFLQERVSAAKVAYVRALRKDPEYMPALIGLGHIAMQEQAWARARDFFQYALSKVSARSLHAVEIGSALAKVYMVLAQFDRAVKILQDIKTQMETGVGEGVVAEIPYRLALALVGQRDYAQAERVLRRFQVLWPRHTVIRCLLHCVRALQREGVALPHVLGDLFPMTPDAIRPVEMVLLGRDMVIVGQPVLAVYMFYQAFGRDPDCMAHLTADDWCVVARWHAAKGETAARLGAVHQALIRDPQHVEALDMAVRVAIADGNFSVADKYLQAVPPAAQVFLHVRIQRALVAIATGAYDLAIPLLTALIADAADVLENMWSEETRALGVAAFRAATTAPDARVLLLLGDFLYHANERVMAQHAYLDSLRAATDPDIISALFTRLAREQPNPRH